MTKPKFFCLIFFLSSIFPEVLLSQTRDVNIDSLRQLVDVAVHDSSTINDLLYLSYLQTFHKPQEAIDYALTVREEAPKIPFNEAYLKTYYMIAKVYNGMSQYEKAKEELDRLVQHEELSDFPEIQCDCYKALGHYYRGIYELDEAADNYLKSIEIGKKLGDFGCYGGCLISLGSMYADINNDKLAQKYYEESLASLEGTKRYHILADVFDILADYQETFEQRMAYTDSSLHYALLARDTFMIFDATANMGDRLAEMGQIERAAQLYDEALLMMKGHEEQFGPVDFLHFAVSNLEIGRKEQATQLFRQSQIALENFDGEYYHGGYIWRMSRYHELSGNYKEALKYEKDYFNFIDSLRNEEMVAALSESNSKYQTEQKEAEIARQQLQITRQKNNRNLLLLGSGGIIILLGAFFFGLHQRTSRKRRETELALQLEQDRAEDLEKLSKVKTDFFNNVSHELRTPLTLIMAPLEDALQNGNGYSQKAELEMALHNSKRLLNLTNELLDLSKIDAAKLELEESVIELKPFLIRILNAFQSLAQSRNITTSHNLEHLKDLHIAVDVGKLEKVINNLIGNAIKYSDDGGQVKLKLNHKLLERDRLSISIKDNGPGIPKEEHYRIFDRFYQSPHKSQSSGTGIGLALVKELVQLLGGQIQVQSLEGQGSDFSFVIPVKKADSIAISSVESDTQVIDAAFIPIKISGRKPRILVVEDDLEMSKYLKGLLEDDYDVDVVYNGVQALDKCSRTRYDLISSDVMMPEMDGFQFREKLNKSGEGSDIPFIMLTARIMEEDRLRGLRLGVDDYITKPFSSAEFKARVYNLISNKVSRDGVQLEQEEELSHEEEFVRQAESVVIAQLDNSTFGVQELAEALNYSSRQLGRLLQRYTGLTPVKFILEIRLQKAFQIIQSRKYATINEVRYEVGIESASYFSTKFKERFGISPNEIVAEPVL